MSWILVAEFKHPFKIGSYKAFLARAGPKMELTWADHNLLGKVLGFEELMFRHSAPSSGYVVRFESKEAAESQGIALSFDHAMMENGSQVALRAEELDEVHTVHSEQ